MRLTFGINDRAETQIRPQWDHDGPRPTALGFQPNEAAHG